METIHVNSIYLYMFKRLGKHLQTVFAKSSLLHGNECSILLVLRLPAIWTFLPLPEEGAHIVVVTLPYVPVKDIRNNT